MSRWHIPNIIKGTGLGKNDWVCGREVNLCSHHAKQWHTHPHIVRLINNGILQHYNQYNYGSIVLCEVIDWRKPPTIAKSNEFWIGETK
jgi:hypothetical protein